MDIIKVRLDRFDAKLKGSSLSVLILQFSHMKFYPEVLDFQILIGNKDKKMLHNFYFVESHANFKVKNDRKKTGRQLKSRKFRIKHWSPLRESPNSLLLCSYSPLQGP